ncbi:MAG TPA: nucleotide exchange factor GrpE [Chlamydiales bacterium]|nr:nucleotide exchange factor GrpE [Chlamydiales bacterium]
MDEEIKLEEHTAPIEEDYKDKYFRQLAEMENMRKRMAREKQEMIRFGVDNAIGEFIPVIDQFENALRFADQASGEVKSWAAGFQMFLSQLKEVLNSQGISTYDSEGQFFDTALHEAVEVLETTEVPEGMILQEYTKGYKSSARVIRPARVKVAKNPAETSAPEELLEPKEIYE